MCTRSVEAGYFASFSAGRRGRLTSSPPQFGQRPPSTVVAHDRQKVHSNEQIIASVESGDIIAAGRVDAEIGEVVTGAMRGREAPGEVTLFKSVGVAVEDVVTANLVYEKARK